MQLAITIRNVSLRRLTGFAVIAQLILISGCASANDSQNGGKPELTELIVLSQSMGRGVPELTQQKFDTIKRLLMSKGLDIHEARWGIEGEKRMCVVLSKSQLAQLTPDIENISEGVPLLEVTYRQVPAEVVEYCK